MIFVLKKYIFSKTIIILKIIKCMIFFMYYLIYYQTGNLIIDDTSAMQQITTKFDQVFDENST